MSESDDIKATVYQTDGVYMALCNRFPGITGEGSSREECIKDLTSRIQLHVDQEKEDRARKDQEDILKRVSPMRRR